MRPSKRAKKCEPGWVIAVHGGAGYHSTASEPHHLEALRLACIAAKTAMERQTSCEDAVVSAVSVLEDAPCTNAGLGSNLNLHGKVEVDASVMDGNGSFGAVAAVPGLRNPVVIASQLRQQSSKGLLPLGRVPPIMLCGEGARSWATEKGLCTAIDDETLVTSESKAKWSNYIARLEKVTENACAETTEPSVATDDLADTVGAVMINNEGHAFSAVSSGGIALKFPGRIGEAAAFGCGCFANQTSSTSVACSCSGTGEEAMRRLLSFSICVRMCEDNADSVEVMKACLGPRQEQVHLGALTLKLSSAVASDSLSSSDAESGAIPDGAGAGTTPDGVEFVCAHTTKSFAVGYMTSSMRQPKVLLSRYPTDVAPGRVFVMEKFIPFASQEEIDQQKSKK